MKNWALSQVNSISKRNLKDIWSRITFSLYFHVYTGFVDKTDKWRLESRFFPSKVGGKPAWLDMRNLPATDCLLCKMCQKPMTFLAQVYAPDDDDEGGTRVLKDTCYHRTVFIFLCLTPSCNQKNSNQNFAVFRCQLPKENEFYPPIDPPDDEQWKKEIVTTKYSKLCLVCGCLGTKVCGGCKRINYCTKDHQVLHWRNGHKLLCQQRKNSSLYKKKLSLIYLKNYSLQLLKSKVSIQHSLCPNSKLSSKTRKWR